MTKWVLVTGTSRTSEDEARQRAYVVGCALARAGLGLVVGDWPGVDASAAEGFNSELSRQPAIDNNRFIQIRYRSWSNGWKWMKGQYRASPTQTMTARTGRQAIEEAISRCDAAIMIGGGSGTLRVARQFISVGKPVFPLPFTGGRSDEVFQELLRGWYDNPIPGLTRNQVLRLALPWTTGASTLIELMRGTLADHPDIFISYRRADSGSAVGRLHRDLSDYFGNKRIFVDETRIEPSAIWEKSITDAIDHCKLGLVVFGKRWLDGRLSEQGDVLKLEVERLLMSKTVLPILVDDAGIPTADQLPTGLQRLPSIQARPISNANWDVVMLELIRTIEAILTRPLKVEERTTTESAAPPDS